MPERSVGCSARGRRPGPAYWDTYYTVVDSSQGKKVTKDKWIRSQHPTEEQSAKTMAQMVADAVEVAMSNHMYRFDGKVYLQTDSGPIGDELSQAVARLIMIWWDRTFLEKCSRLGLDIMMYMRYVRPFHKGCHKRHGSFTDLRPGVGTWPSPYLWRSENHPISVKKSPWNGRYVFIFQQNI